MNFFAWATLKKSRFCLSPPSSMIRFFSLKRTLASERVGTSTAGFLPALAWATTSSASFTSFWVVLREVASIYSASSSGGEGARAGGSSPSSFSTRSGLPSSSPPVNPLASASSFFSIRSSGRPVSPWSEWASSRM